MIRDHVRNRQAGLGRLMFWQSAVDEIANHNLLSVPKHPVALALYNAFNSKRDLVIKSESR